MADDLGALRQLQRIPVLGEIAMTLPPCDVAIVGGGTAGCAAALSMRMSGVPRVVVIERATHQPQRIGECIPPDTSAVLTQLGLWHDFVAEAHQPCLGSCSAWGSADLGFNDFLLSPHGCGWHLDRPRFDAWLGAHAISAGAEIRRGLRFRDVQRRADGTLVLQLSATDGSPQRLSARIAVDATGTGAQLARAFGAHRLVHDRLSCYTAVAEPAPTSVFTDMTLLEAAEYGWWYAARIPGDRVAVAVTGEPATLRTKALHSPPGWRTAIESTRHLSGQLAGAAASGRIVARAVRSSILDQACGPDWFAIGDAACSYDPLMSRGIHDALHDGAAAGKLAASRLAGDVDALRAHHAAVAARFSDYLAHRHMFYRVERQWPHAPFWTNRRARAATLADLTAGIR
jgi:flavin-dependent dehydrogenase